MLLVATAIAALWIRSLFAVVMLFGIYSLLTASIFITLDAVDVAFTEAAVGAGVSTVLLLVTLARTGHRQILKPHSPALPLTVVIITGAVLMWGTSDMPRFGDPAAPIHHHVAPRYIEDSPREVGLPNMVTSVLASYRGFDTLGETAVVFTAGVGVLALLGIRRRKPLQEEMPRRGRRGAEGRKRG
jgi:multicomponent Na+:H+ antiporter subunit B